MVDCIVTYVMCVRRIQKHFIFHEADIIVMDETCVWNDTVSNSTVEKTCSKDVSMKRTGYDKVRVSLCLTGKADGTRLKLFMIFKTNKRENKALHDNLHRQC